mgnify:CR=1 FL=1
MKKLFIRIKEIFVKHWLTILLHVLAWVIVMVLPRYIVNTFGDGNKQFLKHFYVNLGIYGALFYLNYLVLVPLLFTKNRKILYILSGLVLITGVCIAMWQINEKIFFDRHRQAQIEAVMKEINEGKEFMKPPLRQIKIMDYFFTAVLTFGFSFGLRMLEQVTRNEKEKKELEREKLNSELAFLKSQVSPHFFFNTLNNIYSLIAIDTANAQDAVLKLSRLMRYLLYESEKGETRLSEEIDFLVHYIDLMRLRLSPKVRLDVNFPKDIPEISIPPLLFIPLVENAFKHGVSNRDSSFIELSMNVKENELIFNSLNSIHSMAGTDNQHFSGIGLENVKKRLELIYPGSYSLITEKRENNFFVELSLKI